MRRLGSRLPAGLRGTFKDLSREIRFSPDLQPRCIPAFRRFSPLPPPSPLLAPTASPGNPRFHLSVPFGVSTPRRFSSENIPSVLSPGYFSPGVRSHCHVRTPWGPRIGPLSSELSVNAPFVSSFLPPPHLPLPPPLPVLRRLPERKRRRN